MVALTIPTATADAHRNNIWPDLLWETACRFTRSFHLNRIEVCVLDRETQPHGLPGQRGHVAPLRPAHLLFGLVTDQLPAIREREARDRLAVGALDFHA